MITEPIVPKIKITQVNGYHMVDKRKPLDYEGFLV